MSYRVFQISQKKFFETGDKSKFITADDIEFLLEFINKQKLQIEEYEEVLSEIADGNTIEARMAKEALEN